MILAIRFFVEPPLRFDLTDKALRKRWIKNIFSAENLIIRNINFIFSTDDYLIEINEQYLHHPYFTDIITFPQEEMGKTNADIFISINRVKDNAATLNIPFEMELNRVMIHGVLHLCGYKDKTEAEIILMRQKEDEAIAQYYAPT